MGTTQQASPASRKLLNASAPLLEGIPIIRAQGAAESKRELWKADRSSIDWYVLATAVTQLAADLLKDAC